MAYSRKLEVRPSVTEAPNGTMRDWRSLSEAEREVQEQKLCQRISENLSVYYSEHPDEWERLRSGL